jgi:hypothetical protein
MSSINPNNINGSYPVAGQDNDSQGFRDNFTNLKNNLNFAKSEIEDLQNNALLKSGLSGTTLNNNLNYAQLIAAQMLKVVQTKNDIGTITTSTATIDWSTGNFQTLTTGYVGSTILTLTGWPTSGYYTKLRLQITVASVSHTITLSSSGVTYVNLTNVQGEASNVLTFPATGTYLFELTTYDSGATITVRDLLRNYESVITGTTGAFTFANITGTTASTSTTTGALVVAGGAGIAGNLATGGGRVVLGTQFSTPTANVAVTVNAGVERLIITPNSYSGTFGANVTLPNITTDGTLIAISSNTAVGGLQVNGSWGGVVSVSPSANVTLAAGGQAMYLFSGTASKWFKVA